MDRFKLKCQEEIAKLGCSQTLKNIPKKKYDNRVQVLKNDQNKSLKSYLKLKGYRLINLPDLGLKDVLAIPKDILLPLMLICYIMLIMMQLINLFF